jgi:glucose/arabinose dehydrogenase
MFYTGSRFADWKGNAFIGGLSSETLLRLTLKGDKVDSEERIGVQRRIRDVIKAPDGAVLLLSDGKSGELLRLTPAPR